MTNKLFTKGDFERIYSDISTDASVFEILCGLYAKNGVSEMKATEMARETVYEVARYSNIKSMLLKDESTEMLDEFLSCLGDNAKDEQTRMLYLQELAFGFGLYQSEEAVKKLHDGKSIDDLFNEYIKDDSNRNLTEEELKQNIKNSISGYYISEKNMTVLIEMLKNSKTLHYTSAVAGEEAERFKSVIAAYIYVNSNGKININEAVGLACTAVDVEDVADAVGRGLIAKDKARKIIGIILAAACVAFVVYAICNGGVAVVVSAIGNIVARLTLALVEMKWLGLAKLVLDAGVFSIEAFKFYPFIASLVTAVISCTLVEKAYDKLTDFVGEKVAKLVYLDSEDCYEESYIVKGLEKVKDSFKNFNISNIRYSFTNEKSDTAECCEEEIETVLA